MKKILLLFALMLSLVGLTGCSVSGKTYVYDSFEYEAKDGDSNLLEDAAMSFINSYYAILEFNFKEDGTVPGIGKWEKDGLFTIEVDGLFDDYELKIRGNSLVIKDETDDFKFTVIYKVKK